MSSSPAPLNETGLARVDEIFGADVFSRKVMRQRLPKDVFKSLVRTMDRGEPLDALVADVVAAAMKDWAIENGDMMPEELTAVEVEHEKKPSIEDKTKEAPSVPTASTTSTGWGLDYGVEIN